MPHSLVLLWPRSQSDIGKYLDRVADQFVVVDTNDPGGAQALSSIRHPAAILDPFPGKGRHYPDLAERAAGDRNYVAGLDTCREVLRALNDPSLAHSSIEELVEATAPAVGGARGRAGWLQLSWLKTLLYAVLVFASAIAGNLLMPDNGTLAALTTALVFAVLHAAVHVVRLFSGRANRKPARGVLSRA